MSASLVKMDHFVIFVDCESRTIAPIQTNLVLILGTFEFCVFRIASRFRRIFRVLSLIMNCVLKPI